MALNVKRLLPWILGLLILAAIAAALRPRPLPVDLAAVSRGPLQVTLSEEGETRVKDRFVISAPLAGRVLRIDFEPGDAVQAGETVLATFEPTAPNLLDARSRQEAEARVRAAQASVGRAQADLKRAESEVAYWQTESQRIARLAADGIVSQGDEDQAELELSTRQDARAAAAFAVETARHQLEVARAALRYTSAAGKKGGEAPEAIELTSPIDGSVLRRLRESEAVVAAGEPLLEVGDPAQLEIVADFLSRDAVSIRPGQRVILDEWGGEKPLEGVVRRVEPAGFLKISALGVEEQRVNVIVDFKDPRERWQTLGDGYRVLVEVVLWEGENVLQVPVSALFRQGDDWAAFVLEGGRAHQVKVEIGQRNGLEA
ncbi:MAG: HlyD family efflux transporter periplasmic adaptor subunit, partial [Acidobacteria bacterium]|nr:HlyD family efflux transporter periplasmic adaptor subunit [Acidobacteriota bacterium]